MQIEIPALGAKAPSMKSFFDAVLSQQKRFSFLGGSTTTKIATAVPANPAQESPPPSEEVQEAANVAPVVAVVVDCNEAEQRECVQRLVSYLESRLLEDVEGEKSCFIGSSSPPISLLDYVDRLVRYSNQWADDTPSATSTGLRCVTLAVDYLERSQVRLTPRSVHRYLMSATLLAIKYTEDFAISNKFWGDVGGCKLQDVNRMEAAFCTVLGWNFRIQNAESMRMMMTKQI